MYLGHSLLDRIVDGLCWLLDSQSNAQEVILPQTALRGLQ
jgi:hypothetical protein